MPPLTRGPLPAGVYWRRRVFVLALAATLVFVIASVLGGGSDAQDDDVPAAQQAAGDVEASETITVDHRKKGRKGKRNRNRGAVVGPSYDPNALVEPDGNCDPADVRITPRVQSAVAGAPVLIGLSVRTVQADACYFRIGSDKVTIKVSLDGREVWASRECPGPVPTDSVVVRRMVATLVEMQWTPHPVGARRGRECPGADEWLLPDDYTVTTAALGGEPAETDFELTAPVAETKPPDPKGDRKGERGDPAGDQQRDEQREEQRDEDERGDEPTDTSTDEPRR